MVRNLLDTGTPFDYKRVDFGKDKYQGNQMWEAGDLDIPDYNNRWIEKTFEDSD